MAHKKMKNELSSLVEDNLKKSDKMQTFVRDFRNAVETRVRSMEDSLAQNILKIESHFDLKKSQIPQETLQMRFLDFIEESEGKKQAKKTKDTAAEDVTTKTRTTKKKTRVAPTTARRGRTASRLPVEADDQEDKNAEIDPSSCNIIEVLCKGNIDLDDLNVPPELAEKFLENVKKLQEKAGSRKKK